MPRNAHSLQPPAHERAPEAATRPQPPPQPESDAPDRDPPQPAATGALFQALVEAGASTMVAYTADEQTRSMVSNSVAAHTQPVLEEVRQLSEQVRDLGAQVRDLAMQVRDLARTGAERHRELAADIQSLKEAGAARDRKLDVLAAQMRLVIGGFGLLVTALIAVFSILFAR